ncbi:hypothetical protein [Rhodopirellula sp. MGV]|uniref:hypothetical protein n=1 Tax=Rhodopirellula sp. MGV TaxID=2023130 RepID=UPI00117B0C34|nr:hypothetical protein [Rhodopirellula sp. MGV]
MGSREIAERELDTFCGLISVDPDRAFFLTSPPELLPSDRIRNPMPSVRRSSERRRRVLYQAHVTSDTSDPSRRGAADLREAREPASQFGSRVNRHLRGRWFALVPVSLRSMVLVAIGFLFAFIALTIGHHMAVTWPPLVNRDGLARPLRLDRPDSFGAWWLTMNLLVCTGASYLIYGLRLHRRDDYRGQYQLWRLTTVVVLITCVHSVVGLVGWLGACLDLALGDRAVLSGGRWLRILLDVGGVILFMRLAHETYRCRPSLVFLSLSGAAFALFEAAAWNVFVVDSMVRSTIVLSAPFAGCSLLTLAFAVYLRVLFRQVRNIADGPTLRERVEQWKSDRKVLSAPIESDFFAGATDLRPAAADLKVQRRPAKASEEVAIVEENSLDVEADDNASENTDTKQAERKQKPKRPGLLERLRRRPKPITSAAENDDEELNGDAEEHHDAGEDASLESDSAEATEPKPKKKWFRLPSRKPRVNAETEVEQDEKLEATDNDDAAASNVDEADADSDAAVKPKRKGWFALRLKPPKADTAQEVAAETESTEAEDEPSEPKPGLFARVKSMLPAKKSHAETDEADDDDSDSDVSAADLKNERPSKSQPAAKAPLAARSKPASSPPAAAASLQSSASQPVGEDDDEEFIDEDDIDWDSLSKAERRRLRKKIRRSGRAA